jgi:hypothetical protein
MKRQEGVNSLGHSKYFPVISYSMTGNLQQTTFLKSIQLSSEPLKFVGGKLNQIYIILVI